MTSKALVMLSGDPDAEDRKAIRILEHMGAPHSVMKVSRFIGSAEDGAGDQNERFPGAIIAFSTLLNLHRRGKLHAFLDSGKGAFSRLLIFNISPQEHSREVLGLISGGIITEVLRPENKLPHLEVSAEFGDITGSFTGLSFGPAKEGTVCRLKVKDKKKQVDVFARADGEPFFIRLKSGSTDTFLIGGNEVLDIEGTVTGQLEAKEVFPGAVTHMMFIRHILADACWQVDETFGCVIVDDPLIRERYGALKIRAALELMDRHEFTMSFAYIPWNHGRSQSSAVDIFHERKDRLSICVHGCDHTAMEYGIHDEAQLNARAWLALNWMDRFREGSGLSYDRVMVFPQLVFSREALRVLGYNGFIAAVNSRIIPKDEPGRVKISHLMGPACLAWPGVPLFLRRHLVDVADFALDVFFGRSVIIASHQHEFAEGGRHIVELVDKLNDLNGRIRWTSLGEIVNGTVLWRQARPDMRHYIMLSPTGTIHNTSERPMKCAISFQAFDIDAVTAVTVNGKPANYSKKGSKLSFKTSLAPGKTALVEISFKNPYPAGPPERGLLERMRIYSRRHASELRDNHPWLARRKW